jgi:hypothetical protein
VAKLKSQGLKDGKIGLTHAPKKLPNKFKMLKLGLEVLFENKKTTQHLHPKFFFLVEKVTLIGPSPIF